MTKKELVKLTCRALALNLLLWSLEGVTYIPISALSVSHYARIEMKSATQEYYFRHYLILFATLMVVSITLFLAVIWIYKCGATVEAFPVAF